MADRMHLGFPIHHFSIFVFLLSFIYGHSFYLPSDTPHDFSQGEPVFVKVNKLASTKTNLSYSFYSLPYCRPHKIVNDVQNLGEIIRGDHIQNSPYVFHMGATKMCNIVCRITLNEKTAKEFREKIDDGYRAEMILDRLPLIAPVTRTDEDSPPTYQLGYFVGRKERYTDTEDEKYFINNHLSFIVKFHKNVETFALRIVGFEVKAFSINHEYDHQQSDITYSTTCGSHGKRLIGNDHPNEVDVNSNIIFTYDVEFEESDIKWSSRWDTYLIKSDGQSPWFPIVNSLMNVLLISGMVAAAMLATLCRHISIYNQLEKLEEGQEETGWKLIHTDVFQPPVNSELLCVYVGTGVQAFGMIAITVILGVLGFLSPSNRGGLMTVLLLLWALMGIFGGFAMAILYKTFGGSEWLKPTLKTACMFPGIVFCVLFVLNAILLGEQHWEAVPFSTMFHFGLLWFPVFITMVSVGSYIGFKQSGITNPVKTNEIAREIPEQSWYMNPYISIMIGGIMPFGVVFNEFFFMLSSFGLHRFYYIFGLVLVVLIIVCAEITILLCYYQLCGEDYRWWWRSYLTSGSTAFYLFVYATFYFFTKLNVTELVPSILYFGYMLIASYGLFVLTGTMGFYACLWFTRLIYSSVKIV